MPTPTPAPRLTTPNNRYTPTQPHHDEKGSLATGRGSGYTSGCRQHNQKRPSSAPGRGRSTTVERDGVGPDRRRIAIPVDPI